MPAEVKILVEGCTNADAIAETGEEKTQPTITLVRDREMVMVVDPGILESQQVLVDALARENLTPDEVNLVCITHSHLDHYRNAGMFKNAQILEYFGLWHKNTVQDWQEQFGTNIQILRTPGHDYTDITLFVNTADGIVAICGDVFWKENHPADPKDDRFASDCEKLRESRELVLKMADWIIPGHGKMFKSQKAETQEKTASKKREPKNGSVCAKCGKPLKQIDKCLCRTRLCFRCCECDDCDVCSCGHRQKISHE